MTITTPISAVGVPIGGGLGNKKVMLVEIAGQYATGGFVIPGVTQDPALMLFSGGVNGVFASGKVKLMTPTFDTDHVASAEVANETSVAIKGLIVF